MPIVRKLTTKWQFQPDTEKVKKFSSQITSLKNQVRGVGNALKPITNDLAKFAKMSAAFGAAMTTAILIPSIRQQDALAETMTLVTKTGEEFAKSSNYMLKLGRKLSTDLVLDAKDIFTGFYQVLSTGAVEGTAGFEKLSETALKMGKTVGLSPAEAVERLNDSIKAFGLETSDAETVADKFFKTTILAATNLPQLTMALRQAAPVASGLGISLEETLSVLAGFADVGIKGAEAGTAFKMVVTRLAAQTPDAAEALAQLGVDAYDADRNLRPVVDIFRDLQVAFKRFNGEQRAQLASALAGNLALPKFFGLLNKNMDVLQGWTDTLRNDSAGALELAFQTRIDSALERLKKLKIMLTNIAAEIGDNLLPIINQSGAAFAKWASDNKENIIDFGRGAIQGLQSFINWIVQNKDSIVDFGRIIATVFVAGKIIAYGVAIKSAIAAFMALKTAGVIVTTFGAASSAAAIAAMPLVAQIALIGTAAVAAAAAVMAVVKAYKAMRAAQGAQRESESTQSKLYDSAIMSTYKIRAGKAAGAIKAGKENEIRKSAPMVKALKAVYGDDMTIDEIIDKIKGEGTTGKVAAKKGKDDGKTYADNFAKGAASSKKDPFAFLRPGFSDEIAKGFKGYLQSKAMGQASQADVISGFIGRKVSGAQAGDSNRSVSIIQHNNNIIRSTDPAGVVREMENDSARRIGRKLGTVTMGGAI